MRKHYFLLLMLFFAHEAFTQVGEVSKNNFTGLWGDAASWVDGSAPVSLNIKGFSVTINGYVTVPGNLSVANEPNGSVNKFTVNDTLVVFGNLIMENDAMPLVVPAGGVLVVFGDLTATNKIKVENGGIIAVKGTVKFTNSGQDVYTDTGGKIYSDNVQGNITALNDSNVLITLRDSPDPKLRALYWFMMQRPDLGPITPLPVELLYFRAKNLSQGVQLEWASAKEWDFSHYTLERSSNGKDFQPLHDEYVAGDSYSTKKYAYVDEQPLYGANYYRLLATDIDGTVEVKGIALAYSGTKGELEVSPNPSSAGNVRLTYAGASEGTFVYVYNSTGLLVQKKEMAQTEISLPIAALPKGLYIIKVVNPLEAKQTKLIVK